MEKCSLCHKMAVKTSFYIRNCYIRRLSRSRLFLEKSANYTATYQSIFDVHSCPSPSWASLHVSLYVACYWKLWLFGLSMVTNVPYILLLHQYESHWACWSFVFSEISNIWRNRAYWIVLSHGLGGLLSPPPLYLFISTYSANMIHQNFDGLTSPDQHE